MKNPVSIFGMLLLAGIVFFSSSFFIQEQEYSCCVYPVKMNVVYIGVDNLVSVSVSGMERKNLVVSVSGDGTITPFADQGNTGLYNLRVNSGYAITLNVGDSIDGTYHLLSSWKYRVKRTPAPVAYLGSVKGDTTLSKEVLLQQHGIFARMENFDFDMSTSITYFSMSVLQNGSWKEDQAHGPALTVEMQKDLANTAVNDKVLFQNITTLGPDGIPRKVPGIVITVK